MKIQIEDNVGMVIMAGEIGLLNPIAILLTGEISSSKDAKPITSTPIQRLSADNLQFPEIALMGRPIM